MVPGSSSFSCPVCGNPSGTVVLRVPDHSVTGEVFDVCACPDCTLRFTANAPEGDAIGRYYASADYISHSNTRQGIVNKLYHIVRRRTLAGKHHLLREVLGRDSGAHLDIGAGTGAFVQYMNGQGWASTGIEPDATACARAREVHGTELLPPEALYGFEAGRFDAITMWHVLEHVHDLHPYLAQIRKILKPSGVAFIALPNYTSRDAAHYGAYWAAYDVPRHLYHFSPQSVRRLADLNGLRVTGTRPMWYDAFYISLLSEKYRTGKQQLLKGFWNGALSNATALAHRERCSSLVYLVSK